jgi:hypothetical protein
VAVELALAVVAELALAQPRLALCNPGSGLS